MERDSPPPDWLRFKRGPVIAFTGLLALIFLGYFRRFSEFGFYGDDAAFFGGVINRSWGAEWQNLWFCLTRWPQGRPLGMGLNLGLFPHVAFSIGGLEMLHVFAFGIAAANTILFYRLVARVATPFAAFVAAGFYGLAPAHTTQISLVFGFNFGIAIFVGLCAVHAALSHRWVLYGLSTAVSLTMVEPAAVFALVVSVGLVFSLREFEWRRVILPILIWCAVVAIVLFARQRVGDPWGQERVSEIAADPVHTLMRSLQSAATGSMTHASLVFSRLALPFHECGGVIASTMIAATFIAMIGIGALPKPIPELANTAKLGATHPTAATPMTLSSVRLVSVGLLCIVTIYASYFRSPWHPANWTTGFMSGVHVIAATGGGLVIGGLARLIEGCPLGRCRLIPISLASVFLAALVGFGQLVQRDYAAAWQFQREFWGAYEELCPDAGPGVYIVVLDRNLPTFRFIERNSWTAEVLPSALFHGSSILDRRGKDWLQGGGVAPHNEDDPKLRHSPSVIFTAPTLEEAITIRDGMARWKPTYYFMLPKTENDQPVSGHLIVLERQDKRWHRRTGTVAVDGGAIELKGHADAPPLLHQPLAEVYGL